MAIHVSVQSDRLQDFSALLGLQRITSFGIQFERHGLPEVTVRFIPTEDQLKRIDEILDAENERIRMSRYAQ